MKQTESVRENGPALIVDQFDKPSSTHRKINKDSLIVRIVVYVVIHYSSETDSRIERIKIIIKATEKFLQVKGITLEQVNEKL